MSPRLTPERLAEIRTAYVGRWSDLLDDVFAELDAVTRERDILRERFEATQRHASRVEEIAREAQRERDRLVRGEFTAEEIHGICHNLGVTVPLEQFAEGCRAEMVKLYGRCPWSSDSAASNEARKPEVVARFAKPRFDAHNIRVRCTNCGWMGYETQVRDDSTEDQDDERCPHCQETGTMLGIDS